MSLIHHRVRFAPSPSGRMHLGNIRTAVLNYLCAMESKGTFILRIEDTDTERTFEEFYQYIYHDLAWLGIKIEEGPLNGGPYAPYLQSQRASLYNDYLQKFIQAGYAYRCFASKEKLELIKQAQIASKKPPRYDRVACAVSHEEETNLLNAETPFIWRFRLPEGKTSIYDKARGKVVYDLENFSDCPLTRQDGSVTFLFANFVDDVEMKISYIIRGEDHMSNTAIQSAMYDVLKAKKPLFYHTPIICNHLGQKLSKRDFGFSLQDLIHEGYFPEAILNYLILLGNSFDPEIFSLEEAAERGFFEKIHSTGTVQYSLDKLAWVNKKWMQKISPEEFIKRFTSFFKDLFPEKENISVLKNYDLLALIKTESTTLKDACSLLRPFVEDNRDSLGKGASSSFLKMLAEKWTPHEGYDHLARLVKDHSQTENLPAKSLWLEIRLALTGQEHGLNLRDIIRFLPEEIIRKRLS